MSRIRIKPHNMYASGPKADVPELPYTVMMERPMVGEYAHINGHIWKVEIIRMYNNQDYDMRAFLSYSGPDELTSAKATDRMLA